MSEVVVRIGGTVRPEPEPERQLSQMAEVVGEDEFGEWMREYDAGAWVLACVEMFADVISDDGVTRFRDGGVRPLTLRVPHDDENLRHVREAIAQYVDALAASLADDDVHIAAGELGRLPILIEFDPVIETQLSA
jgi:hypothetical protein